MSFILEKLKDVRQTLSLLLTFSQPVEKLRGQPTFYIVSPGDYYYGETEREEADGTMKKERTDGKPLNRIDIPVIATTMTKIDQYLSPQSSNRQSFLERDTPLSKHELYTAHLSESLWKDKGKDEYEAMEEEDIGMAFDRWFIENTMRGNAIEM